MKEYLDLLNFVPSKIICGKKNLSKKLNKKYDDKYIGLFYTTKGSNNSTREYSIVIPRKIEKNRETFEVIGLLQAEMGKTQNGCVSFPNSEPKIINKVLRWFEREFEINKEKWRWYIAINLKEPSAEEKGNIENKIIDYWIKKTKLGLDKSHPKKISYRKVKHTKLKDFYFGCLMIEYKNNLFSQIIKTFLKKITYIKICHENKENIRAFMRGIIAGEGTVAHHKKSRHYGVHISASEEKEREIYTKCLKKIGIDIKSYNNYKEMLISRKENNMQLLNQKLMTLHPKKYAKFLNMMKQYPNIEEETNYFKPKGQNIWNKISQEKIEKIIEMYKSGIKNRKKIAEKVGISSITVNRILRRNNLSKKIIKTPELLRKKIFQFAKKNPKLSQREIAEKFNINESSVRRALYKYGFKKTEKDRLKTPIKKINQVIKLYKENPTIKFKEVIEKVGISDTALVNIRRIYGLHRLGYYYIIGNNPKGKNQYSNSKRKVFKA